MNWYFEVMKKYAVFSGRARRKEYWMFLLFNMIFAFVIGFVGGVARSPSIIYFYDLAVAIPSIAVAIRRMHDTGRSGWWILLPIVNLVFLCQDSQPGDNRYGPNPKGTISIDLNQSDKPRPTTSEPQQYSVSDLEQIEKLASLKDRGHITEEEFTKKKKELLGISDQNELSQTNEKPQPTTNHSEQPSIFVPTLLNKICVKCQKLNPDVAKFCVQCGSILGEKPSPTSINSRTAVMTASALPKKAENIKFNEPRLSWKFPVFASLLIVMLSTSGWWVWKLDRCGNAFASKDYSKAINVCTEYINKGGRGEGLAFNYYHRGISKKEQGIIDEAILDLSKALQIGPLPSATTESIYDIRGHFYLDKHDDLKALSDFGKLIEINPKNYGAYYNRGLANIRQKQIDSALIDFNKAIELNQKDDAIYENRGNIYFAKKQYDMAFADFTKAIEINPNNYDSYISRGVIYFSKGQNEMAIADFSKVIETNHQSADAHYYRGVVYFERNKYDMALVDINRAIELNPNYGPAYYYRGDIYYRQKQYDLALSDVSRAIELSPNNDAFYSLRGNIYRLKKRYRDALGDYRTATNMNPNNNEVIYNVAAIYSIERDSNNACKALRTAINRGFNNWTLIKRNPDFTPIRKSKCYKKIMSKK